jgi:hypothetical protein
MLRNIAAGVAVLTTNLATRRGIAWMRVRKWRLPDWADEAGPQVASLVVSELLARSRCSGH